MNNFNDLFEKIEFAFIAEDCNKHIGTFYTRNSIAAVPLLIKNKISIYEYSDRTEFIIDYLPKTKTETPNIFNHYDAERGLFVYEYDLSINAFNRIGIPSQPIPRENLIQFKNSPLIMKIHKVSFANGSVLFLDNLKWEI